MNNRFNIFAWTGDQWKAASRHIVTAAGTAMAILLWFKLIPEMNAKVVVENVGIIADSLTKIGLAIGAIVTALGPLWALISASKSAAPENQAKATVKNIENNVPINGEKAKLIQAIADQPEVAVVKLTDPALAAEIPSPKVTS